MVIRVSAIIIESEQAAAKHLRALLDEAGQVEVVVQLRDRPGTDITASRQGAVRLAAALKLTAKALDRSEVRTWQNGNS